MHGPDNKSPNPAQASAEYAPEPVFGDRLGDWVDMTEEQKAECSRRSRAWSAFRAADLYSKAVPPEKPLRLFQVLGVDPPSELRWRAWVYCASEQRSLPALLLPVRPFNLRDDGLPSALAVTYLDGAGTPIADGFIGSVTPSSGVQFGDCVDTAEIVIGWRWWSVLVAHHALNLPAAALIRPMSFSKAQLPPSVRRVHLLVEPELTSARKRCAQRLITEGYEVHEVEPPADCTSWAEAAAHG